MRKPIASVEKASKIYTMAENVVTALDTTSLNVYPGELMLILGPSGSGKTTLLSLLGCMIKPTVGEVFINDTPITTLSEKELAKIRLFQIGFVFQQFNLIAPLNAWDNIALPLRMQNVPEAEIKPRADKALAFVGLRDKAKNLPKQLSGGQQQRIAIARALVTNPPMLLCDEPTASLDHQALTTVMEQLQKLATEQGKAVCVVTHDPRLKPYSQRVIQVESGVVTEL
jgi:putative ABC transport system ATP-binding protein